MRRLWQRCEGGLRWLSNSFKFGHGFTEYPRLRYFLAHNRDYVLDGVPPYTASALHVAYNEEAAGAADSCLAASK
jgi:hypothetical protein